MISERDIAGLIRRLSEANPKWTVTTAARLASGSGETVAKLEGGGYLTLSRANFIIQRCAELWPLDRLDLWPENIPFPPGALAAKHRKEPRR
jgi:hypothetical protein